jgi:hypothetical protein
MKALRSSTGGVDVKPSPRRKPGPHTGALRRTLAWAAALAVLGVVFASYLQPQMVFEVANMVWNCF